MFAENLIKTIEIQGTEYDIVKQNMWLIIACNGIEIHRVELFGLTIEDATDHLITSLKKEDK